jgi:hypothetical protein
MVTSTNQKAACPQKIIQHGRNREQKRGSPILHGPSSMHRRNQHVPLILLIRPRGTQSHLGIPLVRGHSTKDRLEERMNRSQPTPSHPQSGQRKESDICPTKQEHPAENLPEPILHRERHHPPRTTRPKQRSTHYTKQIRTLQKGL